MTPAHSPDAVADMLGVSLRTVQQWVSDGELCAINVSRSRASRKPRLRITQHDLDTFLAGRAVGTNPPAQRRRRKAAPVRQYV